MALLWRKVTHKRGIRATLGMSAMAAVLVLGPSETPAKLDYFSDAVMLCRRRERYRQHSLRGRKSNGRAIFWRIFLGISQEYNGEGMRWSSLVGGTESVLGSGALAYIPTVASWGQGWGRGWRTKVTLVIKGGITMLQGRIDAHWPQIWSGWVLEWNYGVWILGHDQDPMNQLVVMIKFT